MPADGPAAPSLYDVPRLAEGEVVLRAATARDAAALAGLVRDVETQVLTGSVHSTAEAERIASGQADPWPSLEWLEEVYAHNPRARRLYERLGFVHEGTARDALLLDGGWVDLHTMGLLAEEWAAR